MPHYICIFSLSVLTCFIHLFLLCVLWNLNWITVFLCSVKLTGPLSDRHVNFTSRSFLNTFPLYFFPRWRSCHTSMPGFPPDLPSSEHHGRASLDTEGIDDVRDAELFEDLSNPLLCPPLPPLDQNEEETQQVDTSWSQDGDLPVCGQWVLSMRTL